MHNQTGVARREDWILQRAPYDGGREPAERVARLRFWITLTAFDLDNLVVNYDMGNLRFDNQLEIEGAGNQAFSDGGDSGSLIVNAAAEAVALRFAGSDVGGSNGLGLTYANPIHRVLQDLRSTLLS